VQVKPVFEALDARLKTRDAIVASGGCF